MRHGSIGAAIGAACLSGALPANALELQSHRAVYDLTLSSAEPSTSLVEASGRLVLEMSGSSCTGYTVEFRNVTEVNDREGTRRVTDLRSSTRETTSPPQLVFSHQTLVDQTLDNEIEGTATGGAGGISVDISSPKETTLSLPRAIFPTAHTRLMLESAEAGERILEATIYDGGDEADSLYETATVIGDGATGLPGASADERVILAAEDGWMARTAWRLVTSYFEQGGADGERMPAYELSTYMLDNGISYDVSFNYGSFSMSGKLTSLTLIEVPACPD
ncbi:DUF1849 family protein [Acuticoccus sp. MNP-M23]|uniref:EipB family protein n=1 Tax=Acuticoccus sp. MNP-M23 TaxID=3072793 RepID=UPI002815CC4C|nr:DUF1849 family protein [Acuticoccus sp. MNP-M23]WMS42850.1 DUF1849 family protein [Acuticoccus sp. MNP-M23]